MEHEQKETTPTPEVDTKKATAAPDERLSTLAAEVGRLRIGALAQSAGAVDPAKVAEVVSKSAKHEIDASGIVKVSMVNEAGEKLRNADGTEMNVAQFIAQLKADPNTGFLFADGASKPKASGRLETETNPWMPETLHLGEQARLLKSAPAFAARLQAAAKALTPQNPFSKEGFNLTAQSQMLRDNPELAAKMKEAVAPKEPNPWRTESLNLTKQVLLTRSAPEKAKRLKAEADAANGPAAKKDYRFTPPPGAFKRMGIGR